MKLPHIIDYYSGDDSIMNNSTKLCVIIKEEFIGKYEQILIIRRIHHFGYKVWLGSPERIEAFDYNKIDGENGPISIITSDNQFIVPRQINSNSKTKIALYKKKIYNVKEKELLKEIVLENNIPKTIDYKLEKYNSMSDEGKGIKGYLNTKSGCEIVLV